MTNHGCYFYHIPKTAGMSTWQLLEHNYSKEAICPGRMWEDIIELPMEQLAGYMVFRGHFLAYLPPYLDRQLRTFTILRDPVERTVSHYCHVLRSPEHPLYLITQSLSLAEFCIDQRTRHIVQNYQTRCLACLPLKPLRKLAAEMTRQDFAAYRLQLALDPTTVDEGSIAPAALYRAAKERLASFVAVGLTERFGESLQRIATALELPPPPAFSMRNVAPNRVEHLDSHTLERIRESTKIDGALY